MTPLQMILMAVVALLIVGVMIAFTLRQETLRRRRMLHVIQGHAAQHGVKNSGSRDTQDKRRAEIARKLKESKEGPADSEKKAKPTIAMMVGQAGIEITVTQFWIYSVVSMVLFILLAKLFGQGPIVMLMAAVVGLLGFPKLVLKRMAARRQKKFLEEFPDALEATIRLLKAGMPVAEAVSMIAREFSGPVGEEMSRIYDKQKIGIALHEAALEGTKRMPIPEMKMFATGLAIQAQTGSSLSDVLQNLSNVIRARFRLKRKIKALSSEAVASAVIIGALPNLLALGMYFANREYIMILFTDPFGKILLAGAVIWMCLGIIIMKAMINFKI